MEFLEEEEANLLIELSADLQAPIPQNILTYRNRLAEETEQLSKEYNKELSDIYLHNFIDIKHIEYVLS